MMMVSTRAGPGETERIFQEVKLMRVITVGSGK